jgi:hypothetical protein
LLSEARSIAAISCHEDLLKIIRTLLEDPLVTRSKLKSELFKLQINGLRTASDQDLAIDLAVKIMTMLDGDLRHTNHAELEDGNHGTLWLEESFASFLKGSLPSLDCLEHSEPESDVLRQAIESLSGHSLIKHAQLEFQGTDNIRDHLKLDRKSGVVYIYHHAAFLKECLRATREFNGNSTNALLPRQICLELLDSVQKVLFPVWIDRSRALLKSLVIDLRLDPEILQYDAKLIRREDEQETRFVYFGTRLKILYAELNCPQPRDSLGKWLERKSHNRHVMLATLIGVIVAVLLGIFALALSAFQAWIAWQQWKHPTNG